MPKQSNMFRLEGTMGGVTFYKTSSDGYLVREKGGVSASRIKTDPAFALTRENNAEFAYAGAATSLILSAFASSTRHLADGRVYARLIKLVRGAMRTDILSPRGQRNLDNAVLAGLNGFEFNDETKVDKTFSPKMLLTVDRATGEVEFNFASFVPNKNVRLPQGGSQFKLIAAAAVLNFETNSFDAVEAETDLFTVDGNVTTIDPISLALPANSVLPIFVLVGVECYKDYNGTPIFMPNSGFSAVKIAKVEEP